MRVTTTRVTAMRLVCRAAFFALSLCVLAAGCSRSSTSDSVTDASVSSAPTPTTEETTTEEGTSDTTTTTLATTVTSTSTTTSAPESADDRLLVDYCAAMNDLDTFFANELPDTDTFTAVIAERREALETTEAPAEVADDHETVRTVVLDFFAAISSDQALNDEVLETTFSTPSFVRSSLVVEQYREANCPGQAIEQDAIVSGAFDFEVGGCMNESPEGDFEEAACDEMHDYQIYHVFDIADGDEYPGSSAIDLEAEPVCIEAFETFIGKPYATSIYYVTLLEPSPESWDEGDREVVCLVGAAEGQLAKDVEGAAE